MGAFEDYYRILQVHHLADREVIEGAYKKLVKKYHPDINGNASNAKEMMVKLNKAYEILHNPVKRREYDAKWKAFNAGNNVAKAFSQNEPKKNLKTEPLGARAALENYFLNLKYRHYEKAYNLASSIDKSYNSYNDFVQWQRAVSTVFSIKEYECRLCETYKNKVIEGKFFKEVAEFQVKVVEYNGVMGILEKDSFNKFVILEDEGWKVFIGHKKLSALVGKFNELISLLNAKSVIKELTQTHSKLDPATGLANRKGLMEKIEGESYRYNRYNRVFSVLLLEINAQIEPKNNMLGQITDIAVKTAGDQIISSLRKSDAVGRWDSNLIMVILPETSGVAAAKVSKKLCSKISASKVKWEGKEYALTVKVGTSEYRGSLEMCLKNIKTCIREKGIGYEKVLE